MVRIFLGIRSSAGLRPLSRGVAQYAIRALYRSDAFFSRFFTVWTQRLTSPLAWGKLGLDVMSVNPNSSFNLENVFGENCGPLSGTSWSGMPCLANMDLRCTTMLGEVVCDSLATSTYRKK